MIRKIRDLLYDQGFTISGARNKLHEIIPTGGERSREGNVMLDGFEVTPDDDAVFSDFVDSNDFSDTNIINTVPSQANHLTDTSLAQQRLQLVRRELFEIRELLSSKY